MIVVTPPFLSKAAIGVWFLASRDTIDSADVSQILDCLLYIACLRIPALSWKKTCRSPLVFDVMTANDVSLSSRYDAFGLFVAFAGGTLRGVNSCDK